MGVLKGYESEADWYTVALRDGTLLRVRRLNLLQMLEVRRLHADCMLIAASICSRCSR